MSARHTPHTLAALALLAIAVPPPVMLDVMDQLGGPTHAWPMVVIGLGGIAALLALIGRASLPLAAFVAWTLVRTASTGFGDRGLEALGWTATGALLIVALVAWPSFEPWAVGALLVGAALNALLGIVNMFGVYPLMWVKASHAGRPVGLLNNPTFWGAYLALVLPLVIPALRRFWWRPFVTVSGMLLIVLSYSAAAIAGLVCAYLTSAWRRSLRFERITLVALAVLLCASALYLRPHRDLLGGRWPYWQLAARAWWSTAPVQGIGPGLYRNWTLWDGGPIRRGSPFLPAQSRNVIQTEAYNEPLQVTFELGVIGLVLGGWLVGDLAWRARRLWRSSATDDGIRAWVLVLVVAGVTMWWTPLFRYGPLAMPVLIAAAQVYRGTARREAYIVKQEGR